MKRHYYIHLLCGFAVSCVLVLVDGNSVRCRIYVTVDMVKDISRKCQNKHVEVESIFRLNLNGWFSKKGQRHLRDWNIKTQTFEHLFRIEAIFKSQLEFRWAFSIFLLVMIIFTESWNRNQKTHWNGKFYTGNWLHSSKWINAWDMEKCIIKEVGRLEITRVH